MPRRYRVAVVGTGIGAKHVEGFVARARSEVKRGNPACRLAFPKDRTGLALGVHHHQTTPRALHLGDG